MFAPVDAVNIYLRYRNLEDQTFTGDTLTSYCGDSPQRRERLLANSIESIALISELY